MRTNKFDNYIVSEFRKKLNEKHKLIFDVGCKTGLRISDIIRLEKKHLLVEKPTIKEMKTGKSKRLYFPKKIREQLTIFANKSNNNFIFDSKSKSGHISRQAVFKAFKRASAELGLNANIGTHSMRKTYACTLFEKGKNYKYIKTKLNHSHASDTLVYLLDEFERKRSIK